MPNTATAKPQAARLRTTPAPARLRPSRAAPKPQPLRLSVVDIIGGDCCVTDDDAKKVFDCAHRAFKKKQPVEISFRGVGFLTSAFLRVAIGSFYGKYEDEEIARLVKCTNLGKRGESHLEHAVRESKEYYADPEGYIALQNRIFDELEAEGWLD